MEKYCQVFNEVYGLKTVCLRFFNVYGPRQEGSSYGGVVSQFIRRLRLGEAPIIFGDGLQTRDFVYIKDAVDAAFTALGSRQCVGEKNNSGSGRETWIRELADVLVRKFCLRNVEPEFVEQRTGEIRRSCASIEKARRMLGYEPRFCLEDGIQNCLKGV